MGRKKGSTNKKKEEIKPVKEKEPVKEVIEAPKAKEWKAHPLVMVEAPRVDDALCQNKVTPYIDCLHKKAMHYGGSKGHCNTSQCLCREFK